MCRQIEKKRSSNQNKIPPPKQNPWRKSSMGLNRGIFHIFHLQIWAVKNVTFLFCDWLIFLGGEWWPGPTSLRLWGWKLRPAERFIYSRLREKDLLIDPPLEKSHYHVWDERVGTQDLLSDLLVKKGKICEGDWTYSVSVSEGRCISVWWLLDSEDRLFS